MRTVVSIKRRGVANAADRFGPLAQAAKRRSVGQQHRPGVGLDLSPEMACGKNLLSYRTRLISNQLVLGDSAGGWGTGSSDAIGFMNVKQWPSTVVSIVQRLSNPDDKEAWNRFCTIYAPLMLRRCRKLSIQASDAEDIVQDVLMRVVRYGLDYEPTRGRFRGWLGTLLRQCIHRHVTKAGKNVPQELLEETAGTVDAGWTADFNAHVLKMAMDNVRKQYDEVQWKAFQLTWIEEHKASQAARILARPVTWVYKTTCLIRQDLLKAIRDITDDEPIYG